MVKARGLQDPAPFCYLTRVRAWGNKFLSKIITGLNAFILAFTFLAWLVACIIFIYLVMIAMSVYL